jgi:hypothetical protein
VQLETTSTPYLGHITIEELRVGHINAMFTEITGRNITIETARCRRRLKTGSDPHLVIASDPDGSDQRLSRTRLRSRSNPARPYICLLSILIRFTLPSTAPELCSKVRPLTTAS